MLAQSTFTTTHHLLSLGTFALVVVAMILAGRHNDKRTRLIAAAVGFGVWLLSAVYYTLPANLEPDKSLPIQACDLLVLLAPLVELVREELVDWPDDRVEVARALPVVRRKGLPLIRVSILSNFSLI